MSDKYELRIPNVFHAGDGNIHPLILYDERDPDQVKRALQAGHDILGKCIELGGSVTGEHGIGAEKIDFMAKQFSGDDLDAMQAVAPGLRSRTGAPTPTKCSPARSAAPSSPKKNKSRPNLLPAILSSLKT